MEQKCYPWENIIAVTFLQDFPKEKAMVTIKAKHQFVVQRRS